MVKAIFFRRGLPIPSWFPEEQPQFVNNATDKIGMVDLWDTVAFDEVAGVKFKTKDGF